MPLYIHRQEIFPLFFPLRHKIFWSDTIWRYLLGMQVEFETSIKFPPSRQCWGDSYFLYYQHQGPKSILQIWLNSPFQPNIYVAYRVSLFGVPLVGRKFCKSKEWREREREGKKGRLKMHGTYGVEKVVLKFRTRKSFQWGASNIKIWREAYTTQREVSMRR